MLHTTVSAYRITVFLVRINTSIRETLMHPILHSIPQKVRNVVNRAVPRFQQLLALAPISFMTECTLSGRAEGHNLMRERRDRSGNIVLTPDNNNHAKRLRGHTGDNSFSHAAKTVVPVLCRLGNIN